MDRGPRLLLCQALAQRPALADCKEMKPISYPTLRGEGTDSLGREAWLEQALATCPDLLLIDRIDHHASNPVLVGRQFEIPNRGQLDLLFLETTGVLTLVETKLAENFGLRRLVFAQVLDYATGLAQMSFDELEDRICISGQPLGDAKELSAALWGAAGRGEPSGAAYEEWCRQFRERVTDNLQHGRLRLVIVADRIDPRLQEMLEFAVGGVRQNFQVALVEITPYQLSDQDDRLLLVPNLRWGRTPSIPPIRIGPGKVKWTEETFLEQMRQNNADDEVAVKVIEDFLSWMKRRAQELGPNAELKYSNSTATWPAVNLRIQGVSQPLPHLAGATDGGAWIGCNDVRGRHPEALTSFLDRMRKLDPFRRKVEQFLSKERSDFWMKREDLGDPAVRAEALAAMAELQDSIISRTN